MALQCTEIPIAPFVKTFCSDVIVLAFLTACLVTCSFYQAYQKGQEDVVTLGK